MLQIKDHPTIRSLLMQGVPMDDELCPRCAMPVSDVMFEIDGRFVCVECFEDWVRDHSPLQLAQMMNIRVNEYV